MAKAKSLIKELKDLVGANVEVRFLGKNNPETVYGKLAHVGEDYIVVEKAEYWSYDDLSGEAEKAIIKAKSIIAVYVEPETAGVEIVEE